jgi:hypothetical protein
VLKHLHFQVAQDRAFAKVNIRVSEKKGIKIVTLNKMCACMCVWREGGGGGELSVFK